MNELKLLNKKLGRRFNTASKVDIDTKNTDTFIFYNGNSYNYVSKEARDQDFNTIRKYLTRLENAIFY